jgi:hypothetical protein
MLMTGWRIVHNESFFALYKVRTHARGSPSVSSRRHEA